jgi:hypothetical protein
MLGSARLICWKNSKEIKDLTDPESSRTVRHNFPTWVLMLVAKASQFPRSSDIHLLVLVVISQQDVQVYAAVIAEENTFSVCVLASGNSNRQRIHLTSEIGMS